jgi:hypothetical protein
MNKKVRGAIFVLICGLFLFQAVNIGAKRLAAPSKPAVPAAKAVRSNAATATVANTPIIHASFRPLRYSLLRGGFNSVDEFFERVHEDPTLHDFYGDCADRNASMHALPEDIVTFSTFRKGNEIKWAQRPVVVKKGEYVMTFCGKTVLARCGNLVSVARRSRGSASRAVDVGVECGSNARCFAACRRASADWPRSRCSGASSILVYSAVLCSTRTWPRRSDDSDFASDHHARHAVGTATSGWPALR